MDGVMDTLAAAGCVTEYLCRGKGRWLIGIVAHINGCEVESSLSKSGRIGFRFRHTLIAMPHPQAYRQYRTYEHGLLESP